MRAADPNKPWQDQLRPLRTEVEAVRKASGKLKYQIDRDLFQLLRKLCFEITEKDELVNVILDGLPEVARTRGVYPENAIRERFLKVERLARQLALVPGTNATIPQYVLSYMQSLFIIQPKELISQAELNNEPTDYSKLNTFEILDRTRWARIINYYYLVSIWKGSNHN